MLSISEAHIRLTRQPAALQLLKLTFCNALKLHAMAGPQRKVAVGDVDQFQRRAADDVPTAGPRFGVDAGLPPREADAADVHLQPRRFQTRDAGQLFRLITQIRKARAEADGVDGV